MCTTDIFAVMNLTIFSCALTLKGVLHEFLEGQLRCSKGVFVLFFIEHVGPICLLHVVKLKVT